MKLAWGLTARIAVILLLGLAVAQGVSFWLQNQERSAMVLQARGQNFSEQITHAVQLLEATAPTQHDQTVQALARAGLAVEFVEPDVLYPNAPRGSLPTVLAERLGSPRAVRSKSLGPGSTLARSLDVQLRDSQWVRLTEQTPSSAIPGLSTALLAQLALTLLLVAVVTLLAVRQATQPLTQLAQAANRLGRDLDTAPLPETGSAEMRHAAQAFNTMQGHIRSLVQERERALAAVSHDLRTPLTRLRLRCELIDDEDLRAQIDKDIAAMANLIDSTLDYLRGRATQEPVRPLDLHALLESLADDARVQGRSVTVQENTHIFCSGRLSSLRRALQNLIDNAFKYGATQVTLVQHDDGKVVHLSVLDNGPGIDPQELDKVVQPYYRADTARTRSDGSVGLGLAIVSDVARLHGGVLELMNLPGGGLRASITLPRSPT
ncbi:MAG: histidine kinase [Comamonadaceae bacterium CG12_big_fil_rev_8_21_14_0_65_59_15]|nr:MAG: histidine kinase [Comamonadaceae bacterium CG12_big_fil_rev_8_21_14_0_65_59_15]